MKIGKIIAKLIPRSLVQSIIRAKAEELGADFADAGTAPNEPGPFGKAWLWATRNKLVISAAFFAAGGWAYLNGCPPVYGITLLPAWATCEMVKDVLMNAGFFLAGAGILDKDSLARLKQLAQGKIPDPRSSVRTGTTGQVPIVVVPPAPPAAKPKG